MFTIQNPVSLSLSVKNPFAGISQIKVFSDNKLYRSNAEVYFVTKYLFNKIDYIIEPNYPKPYNKKRYDWYIPSLDLYIELDGGCRPEAISEKIEINKILGRQLLLIQTKDIYNKNTLKDFL